jgi:hypothetical protein
MPTKTLVPTIANALGSWSDGFNSLGYYIDGRGAYNSGAGFLAVTNMTGRFDLSTADSVAGFVIDVVARLNTSLAVNDTFTEPGVWLHNHDGEINADWRRPFTGADPSYQGLNAEGRTYYAAQNGSGPTTNGAEHFLNQFVPASADYAVEARIAAASDGGSGEYAEIYARATTPYSFYILQYDEGANTWRLGVWNAGARLVGQMTQLASYAGDVISSPGSRLAKLEVQGTSIKGYVDGVLRMSATDATIASAGYPGLRLDAGASRVYGVVVTALYDLGSAKTVTRVRKRIGWLDNAQVEIIIEGSNDGTSWVNAYTGIAVAGPPGTGSFQWLSEFDTTDITGTAYRYWRTYVYDPSTTGADARIGDFRLYVGGVLVDDLDVGVAMRYGHRVGSTAHNWSEGTSTALFEDNSVGDNSTYIGGTISGGGIDQQGLQFDTFTVSDIVSGSLNVYLSANGTTARGNAKNVILSSSFQTYQLGAASDLWGGAWSADDVRSLLFGLLLERGSVGSLVEVDAIRATIYHTTYGSSKMPLREQVRQQILIGREVGTNAAQTLTITGTPTGGTFKLTFNGIETATIAYNAAAAAVQSALEAISTIGTNNVSCSGGALPATPVIITFVNQLAAEPQNLITVTSPAFTGGSSPAGAVTNTTTGIRAVGAGATASIRLRHTRMQIQPSPEFVTHRPAGEKLTNHQLVVKEGSEASIDGLPTYDEMGWLLSSQIARPNTSTLQTSVAYRHVFAFDNRVRDGIATFQAEYGDQFARAHRVKGLIVNSLKLGLRQDGVDLGGSAIARILEDGIAMNPGVATVQTFAMSGTGTFTLRWKGQETAVLNAATETSGTLQTALRALAGINNSTQLTVTGAGTPFTITFGNGAGGPFLGFPQPLLEIRTISGSPAVTMTMTTRGGYTDFPGVVILPRHIEYFLSTTLAALSSSKLTDAFSTSFEMANRAMPVYNLDRSETSWFNYAEKSDIDIKFGLVAHAQSSAMQFLTQARSDTILFQRILATGPLIGASAFPHRLQIDCPVKISKFGPFEDNQEVYAFDYELDGCQDDATNTSLVVTLDNGVASY